MTPGRKLLTIAQLLLSICADHRAGKCGPTLYSTPQGLRYSSRHPGLIPGTIPSLEVTAAGGVVVEEVVDAAEEVARMPVKWMWTRSLPLDLSIYVDVGGAYSCSFRRQFPNFISRVNYGICMHVLVIDSIFLVKITGINWCVHSLDLWSLLTLPVLQMPDTYPKL
jgi:hypothetical protein